MNKLILIGRVVFFDCTNKTLKLRIEREEFTINFPNTPQNLMKYLQEKFAFDDLVKVNAKVKSEKNTNRVKIIAQEISFYK